MTDIPQPADGPVRDAVELTVTLFGDHDAIDQAISEELGRRGCRTHSINIETGWLPSTTHAVVRLDTAAGASALRGLTAAQGEGAHVVAICEDPSTSPAADRLRLLCEECSTSHEVSLIWHGPITTTPVRPDAADPPVRHLALAVVDEMADQTPGSASPSFSTRSVAV
ncbi:MAG: hypothetical protein JWR83_1201 [Aeromicrobium sp.]|nr:hypothetical protein [Aeromicrobium sp.]